MKLKELKDIIRKIVREEVKDVLSEIKTCSEGVDSAKSEIYQNPSYKKPTIKTGNPALDKVFETTSPLNESLYTPVGLSSPMGSIGGGNEIPPSVSDAGVAIPNSLVRDFKGILKASVAKSKNRNGPL